MEKLSKEHQDSLDAHNIDKAETEKKIQESKDGILAQLTAQKQTK
jgi:hypothetical protein